MTTIKPTNCQNSMPEKITSEQLASEQLTAEKFTPKQSLELKNLDAATITLTGKHLIEASAGTGKTYNITRIYLRLLLERELTVEQILLMTFTKDATQELRGRIDAFIRHSLTHWDELVTTDDYFAVIDKRLEEKQKLTPNQPDHKKHIEFLLKRALLFLDEAAIFTIHGFCQRVLNQYAFTSGLPFNANMAANSTEVTLQVCQDWYRNLAKENHDDFMLLASFWSTPDSFLSSFSKAISHSSELSVVDVASIEAEFIALTQQAKRQLDANNDLLESELILKKKGAEQEQRRNELEQLKSWLSKITDKELSLLDLSNSDNKMPDSFIDGKRYGRSKVKDQLLDAFAPVKEVKDRVKNIANKINKANAYKVVKSGIYTIRANVIQQKQALNMLDFDDLINTLANCLNDDTDKRLASQLLEQYPVALIDEFQDTDPKQFGILKAVYYGNDAEQADAGLFLIGDPKQAIYGFRGGDIFAYLNARTGCDNHWLMDTNWRSTPDMIAGYNQLFSSQASGAESNSKSKSESESVFGFGIPYLPVLAGKKIENKQITDIDDSEKALQFVHFSDPAESDQKVSQGSRSILANWCANEIGTLLSAKPTTQQSATLESATLESKADKSGNNTIKPKDIAILVRDGAEARDIKHALQQAGLDSVFMSDRANLFHSQQAKQLLCLFKGILLPENERLFVAAISCGLLGFDAEKLEAIQQDEAGYQSLKFAFVDYRTKWQRQGFITMAINLMHNTFDIPEVNKDRCLTNVLHLCEILQAASVKLSQGQELIHWFEQQCHMETNDVEAELRLESDGDLIRIITQHGSKGLEYPYVFIPFACRHKDPLKFGNKSISYLEYHDKNGNLCLSLDGSTEAKKAMSNEAYAESIRLLYVAITRAERRCYVLTTAFDAYHLSPLGKVLNMQDKDSIDEHLKILKSGALGAIGIREVAFESVAQASDSSVINEVNNRLQPKLADVAVSQFTGNIERDWWLSSFTALSRNIRHAGISNPDRDVDVIDTQAPLETHSEQICFKLAKGAQTGNLLHDIFEKIDFTLPNWEESLENPLLKYGELISSSSVNGHLVNSADATMSNSSSAYTSEDLIAWLTRTINAPFIEAGTSANGTYNGTDNSLDKNGFGCLADIPVNKTLRESEFYFPMQGEGTKALANLLTDHRNSAQREFRPNFANDNSIETTALKHPVMLPTYQQLSGMMHGFIDLVFEYEDKYYLCDYKSSHLGDSFQHYQFDALLDNVEQNYYDLQYLIYSLALHRYLKQNLADYNVDKHFGGVYYLYLRGMTTDPEFQGAGVYHRKITELEINQLDSLFSAEDLSTKQDVEG